MGKIKKGTEVKSFNVRLKKDVWVFLKTIAATQERSMMDVIRECVEKYKKRIENKLTDNDANV